MNNKYLKLLISSGIKALTGAAALAAAAVILKSYDNKDKTVPENSEKEEPKPPEPSESAGIREYLNILNNWNDRKSKFVYNPPEPPAERQKVYVPDERDPKTTEIPKIQLSEKDAVKLGFSFRKKTGCIRITNYHGTEKSVIIPSRISGIRVNEIGVGAFKNSNVESIAIPDSVKKIGESAFEKSKISAAIFGNGVNELPKKAFFGCEDLCTVILPPHLGSLGEQAFFSCRSLRYIELPRSLRKVGGDCFCESGLEGFSANFHFDSSIDGSAFANTPLHRNYHLILKSPFASHKLADILLVGENANVNIKENRYSSIHSRFSPNSICAPCRLDLFWVEYTENFFNAVKCRPEYISGDITPPKIFVKILFGGEGCFPPNFVEMFFDTGNLKKALTVKNDGELWAKIDVNLCEQSLKLPPQTKALTLEFGRSCYGIKIGKYAIISPDLEKLELIGKFVLLDELFAPNCVSLREVNHDTQIKGRKKLTQFIPSGYAVRPEVHRDLIKAFRANRYNNFFDPKIIENVFENGIPGETRRRLSHREKILIAIDVLRSSPELYPDGAEKYSQFLKRHFNYAKKMCGKLRDHPEYLEFLGKFAPEKGDVQ